MKFSYSCFYFIKMTDIKRGSLGQMCFIPIRENTKAVF